MSGANAHQMNEYSNFRSLVTFLIFVSALENILSRNIASTEYNKIHIRVLLIRTGKREQISVSVQIYVV